MPGPDGGGVFSYAQAFSSMGVDNVTVMYDRDTKSEVCYVGFKEVRVRGVGSTSSAAMSDAYDKIREAVKERYDVELPDPAGHGG